MELAIAMGLLIATAGIICIARALQVDALWQTGVYLVITFLVGVILPGYWSYLPALVLFAVGAMAGRAIVIRQTENAGR
jgi:hypothetical protein